MAAVGLVGTTYYLDVLDLELMGNTFEQEYSSLDAKTTSFEIKTEGFEDGRLLMFQPCDGLLKTFHRHTSLGQESVA